MSLERVRAAVLCGGGDWEGHSQTVPLHGRDRWHLHLLANGHLKSELLLPPVSFSEDSGTFVPAVFVLH